MTTKRKLRLIFGERLNRDWTCKRKRNPSYSVSVFGIMSRSGLSNGMHWNEVLISESFRSLIVDFSSEKFHEGSKIF